MNEAPPALLADHIDTLRMTLPPESYYSVALLSVTSPARPRDGYSRAVQDDDGLVWMSNPDRPDMGTSVLLDGETCRRLRSEGRFLTIVRSLVAIDGARASRCDVAFDVQSRATLDLVEDSIRWGKYISRASRSGWKVVDSGDGGRTVYLGSRSSESMLRVYDKAVEQKVPGEWVRFELETKGNRAHPTLLAFLEGVTARAIIADFVRFVDHPANLRDRHASRNLASEWWTDLVQRAVRVCATREKLVKNLVKKLLWFERTMLPSAIQYAENVESAGELLEQLKPWSNKSHLSSSLAAS